MATKKKAVAAAATSEGDGDLHGVTPDDPTYQAPAFASQKDLDVLSQGPEARAAALLADLKRMGAR
jgi:hypothetical protein